VPEDVFETIIKIIFYVFLIWFIIQIILKLSGNSPSIEVILTTGLGVIFSYLLIATYRMGLFVSVNEFMKNSKSSFKKISEDMDEIKRKL